MNFLQNTPKIDNGGCSHKDYFNVAFTEHGERYSVCYKCHISLTEEEKKQSTQHTVSNLRALKRNGLYPFTDKTGRTYLFPNNA